jgi:hypothetical protein
MYFLVLSGHFLTAREHQITMPTPSNLLEESERMKRRIWLVTAAVLLVSLVLPLAGAAAGRGNTGARPIVKFEGIVRRRPADTNIGTWAISGQRVEVVGSTRFVENKGPAVVGAKVVVLARRLGTGQLEAIQIRVVEPAIVTVKIRGFVTRLGPDDLVVNGLTIGYTAETRIVGSLEVGAFVKIEAQMLPAGYVATTIQVVPTERPRVVEFEGTIERMGDTLWKVAGRLITVTEPTVIIGEPEIGKQAEVRARVQSDGTLLALWIKVKDEPEVEEWRGRIDRLPPQRKGLWEVGGRTVHVTPHTEITGVPRVGKIARVKALRYPHRPLVAVEIEVLEPTASDALVPTETPEPAATL